MTKFASDCCEQITLKKAVEMIKAAEQTQQQVKQMTGDLSVNTIKENKGDTKFTIRNTQEGRGQGQGQTRGGAQQRQQHKSCRNRHFPF
jgi:ribosomal protein L19E